MRFSVIFTLCLLSVQNITSTVMLNCALGLVEVKKCPVDGGWSLWTTWSNCEGQCSSVGRQVRTRNCSNPQPSNSGVDCVGNQIEVKGCGVPGCSYEQYETLLAQDSNRLQQLKALKQASGSQNALLTKCLLSHCSFETISQTLNNSGTAFWNALQCVKKNTGCPVAGGWGEWSEWSRCSALCGQGEQFRCHVCCDPPPTSTHTSCQGESCEFQPCTGTWCSQSQSQEGAWSNWSQWSVCSAPCRLGLTRRDRTCDKRNQKKAKKSLGPQANNEDPRSFDYMDYYDNYFDDTYYYEQDEESNSDKEKGFVKIDQLPKLKKRAGEKCDTKIEYYSTEDDEDYSITLSKSVVTTSKMQINQLTSNNLQNVQNLPVATQLRTKPLDSTTTVEHLLGLTTNPSAEHSYFHTVTEQSNFHTTTEHSNKHSMAVHTDNCYPNTVTEHSYLKTVNVKSTKKLSECSQSHNTKHVHKICSVPMDVSRKTPSKPPKELKKPHVKGKGKSTKNNFECTSSTVLSVSTTLQTDRPINLCNSENISTEDKYQTESYNLQTTYPKKSMCTNKFNKDQEEEISIFGNIEINKKYEKGKQNSDEINTDGTESTINERKTYESKSTMGTQPTAKTKCITIKPEDDILNLENQSALTSQPKKSLSQTLRFSITDKTESSKSTSSSLMTHQKTNNNYSNSNSLSFTSSATAGLEKSDLNSSPVGKTITEENLDFNNDSDISNQPSCDIRRILQLPSFNSSFVADDCKGPFEEIKSCNTKPCSEEGGWSSWSAWSPCSKECGLGKQVSTRSCTQPEPVKNGMSCKGETAQKRSCYEQICPVKVGTPRAMMMSGESSIKYDTLNQHSSVFLLYFRFQPFNCSGNLIVRKSSSHCENDRKCDLVRISLYNCYILLVVRKEKCYANLLSSVQLSVGEWHNVLITIVGAAVMMRLDDSFSIQSSNLSCRPLTPNFDSMMTVGGHYIGEIDRLRINFKNYLLQKKHTKRDIFTESEETVEPEQITQVQSLLNKEEITTLSLTFLLHAPCFINESSWRVEVVVKPEFSEGLLFFFRGYNQGELVMVTMEHTRVRLQVKMLSEFGECEIPTDIAPHTWIHVAVSKPSRGPVGLAVNGGERCVVSFLATENDAEEPSIRCTVGIFLGDVPTSVKGALVNVTGESGSLNSPLGLLGSLKVDNHTLDLSRLPHKISSGVSFNHSTEHYKFSSDMASVTIHYEEMLILEGESFVLFCVYDLSSEQTLNSSNVSKRKLDLSEYSATWIKLDLPVDTAFETSGSNITYHITDSGKSTSLNVTHYTDFISIEGFYSCWLQYPLPLQPGLNIITYSVVVVTDHRDESWTTTIFTISNLIFVIVLLLVCIVWCIIEAVINFKRGFGFYYCKIMGHERAIERVRSVIFSKQGTKLLGNMEAVNESYQKCLAQMDADMLVSEFDKSKEENEREPIFSDVSDDDISVDEVKTRIPANNNLKGKEMRQPINTTVGYETEQPFKSFFTKNENLVTRKSSQIQRIKGKVFKQSQVSIDDLQSSDVDEMRKDNESNDGEMTTFRNYTYNNSAEFNKKEVGLIQETSAYKSIENELKLKPEKIKFLNKYNSNENKGKK